MISRVGYSKAYFCPTVHFEKQEIAEIEAAGRISLDAVAVNKIIVSLEHYLERLTELEEFPKPAKVVAELAKVEKAAAAFSDALRRLLSKTSTPLAAALDRVELRGKFGRDRVFETASSAAQMVAACKKAAEHLPDSGPGRERDIGKQQLILRLHAIYAEVGGRAKITQSDAGPSGPFVDFVQCILATGADRKLSQKLVGSQVAAAFKSVRNGKKSPPTS